MMGLEKSFSHYSYIFALVIFLLHDDSRLVMLKSCVVDVFGPFKDRFMVRYIEAALTPRPLVI